MDAQSTILAYAAGLRRRSATHVSPMAPTPEMAGPASPDGGDGIRAVSNYVETLRSRSKVWAKQLLEAASISLHVFRGRHRQRLCRCCSSLLECRVRPQDRCGAATRLPRQWQALRLAVMQMPA